MDILGILGRYWGIFAQGHGAARFLQKSTKGQYSPVQLEQVKLVTSLLYGTHFSRKFIICLLSKAKDTWLMTISVPYDKILTKQLKN